MWQKILLPTCLFLHKKSFLFYTQKFHSRHFLNMWKLQRITIFIPTLTYILLFFFLILINVWNISAAKRELLFILPERHKLLFSFLL